MRLCISYKSYHNLAMFPLLDYATLSTIHTHNLKFILPQCSKDVYKHSFLPVGRGALRLERSTTVGSGGLNLESVQDQPVRCYILMSHQPVFIMHRVVQFLLNALFFLHFSFSAHHIALSVLMARYYWKIDR